MLRNKIWKVGVHQTFLQTQNALGEIVVLVEKIYAQKIKLVVESIFHRKRPTLCTRVNEPRPLLVAEEM